MSTISIDRIAAGGDGVGRLEDGRTVFVPRTSPGDRVEVEVVELKPRFARARVQRVLQPAAERVDPPCVHYSRDNCGGCQLQHLAVPAQLAAKRRIVADALQRIGGIAVDVPPIDSPSRAWRYRTRITLATRGEVIGLHRAGEPDAIFPLEDCLITDEEIMGLWQRLRANRTHLPRDLQKLILRLDRAGGLHVVAVSTAVWDARALAEALGDEGLSIWWHPPEGAARVLAGPRTGYPAMAFEQVNPGLGDVIRRAAVDALGEIAGRTAWDLYGGIGETARALAQRGAAVWSVDADRGAVEWGRQHDGRVHYQLGRVEDVLGRLPAADVAVANPPRVGMDHRVTSALQKWGAEQGSRVLSYVSCDPATLARDLKRMPAFAVRHIQAYDLFPQTAHVETLAILESR